MADSAEVLRDSRVVATTYLNEEAKFVDLPAQETISQHYTL